MNMVLPVFDRLRQYVFGLVVVIDISLVIAGSYVAFTSYARGFPYTQIWPVGFMLLFVALGVASFIEPNKIARIGVVIARLVLVVFLAGIWKEVIASFLPTTVVLLVLAILGAILSQEEVQRLLSRK